MKKSFQVPEKFRITSPLEKVVNRILTPIEEFIKKPTSSPLLLIIATIIALILANSPLSEAYHNFFNKELAIVFGSWEFKMTLHHWINEGLMTFFFFLIALEIKREFTTGVLSHFRTGLLPIIAAIGGIIAPAFFYILINFGKPTIKGWAIPVATDIAFSISVLMLLRHRVPSSLIIFLLALAIVDDLGAIIIIAVFYTGDINLSALLYVLLIFLFLLMLNRAGIYNSVCYLLGGFFIWIFMLSSGIHATLAGVLTAFAIPNKPKIIPKYFKETLKSFIKEYEKIPSNTYVNPLEKELIQSIYIAAKNAQSPLSRMEHALNLPVNFIILPLFALANAGVHLNFNVINELFSHPVSLGIILGLLFGKVLGIVGSSWIVDKFGLASFPPGANLRQFIGVGFLAGIGFTMCIFIAELSWSNEKHYLELSKLAIISASLISGLTGYLWLRFFSKKE